MVSEGSDGVIGSVADKLGVPNDMLIFFGGEGFCLLCSVFYYKYLPPWRVGPTVRHAVAMLVGIAVGICSFGMQFGHMLFHATACYIAMMLLPQSVMHLGVFAIAMSYLVGLHLYRAYMIPEDVLYSIDVSGPLMIATQKITSLAFSLHDGCHGNKEKFSDLQKRYMICKPPTPLEYFSYVFYFQGVVMGPVSFYKDYIAFVEGTDIVQKSDSKDIVSESNGKQNNNNYSTNNKLSPFPSVMQKLTVTLFWMGFHFTLKPVYPEMLNADPEFIRKHSFMYRVWYMFFSMLCCRAKYYVAFSLGDAICNASGLGFNGYDKNGQPKWDLVTNIHVLGIEGATSVKLYLDNWNIQTAVWLRLVCYDRIPSQKRFATFFLSALWHGCYVGYYFTFIWAVLVSETARKARRKLRPIFQSSRSLQIFYNVVTWVATHLMISYMVVPFTVLHMRPTLTFYTYNMYWCLHITCIVMFVILSFIPTLRSVRSNADSSSVNSKGSFATQERYDVSENGTAAVASDKLKSE